MRFAKALVVLLLIVFGIMFFSQNSETLGQVMQLKLEIPFVGNFYSVPVPYWLIVLGSFAVGGVIMWLYLVNEQFRSGKKMKEARSRMGNLEQELNSLRNMPINEQPAVTGELESKEENGGQSA